MSELIFCSFPCAAKPYYLESAKQNIYSIEELCYFLQDNIYLLEENIMNASFCDWVETELHAKELAATLRGLLKSRKGFYAFCMQIIMDSGYFSRNEMQFLGMKLQKMDHQSNYENRKYKADQFMERGLYLLAISEYRNLLLNATNSPSDIRVSGDIWHNMGTAYARMYCFERAVNCYEKAYELSHRVDSLKAASRAACFLEDNERLQWFLQRNHIKPEQFAIMKKNLDEVIRMTQETDEAPQAQAGGAMLAEEIADMGRQVDAWKEEYIGYKG